MSIYADRIRELRKRNKWTQEELADIYVPTSEDVKRCLAAADDELRVPILLASSGSLRRSEICALTPSDVSPFGVRVNKAVVYDSNKKLVIKPPKTKAGHRFCPLPKEIIKEVQNWQYFGITPNRLNKKWSALKNELNLNFKFHALRHYFASELHSQGIPDQYIIQVGGWSSVSIVQQIYQHTLSDKEKIYNEKIVNIFTAELSKSTPMQKNKPLAELTTRGNVFLWDTMNKCGKYHPIYFSYSNVFCRHRYKNSLYICRL